MPKSYKEAAVFDSPTHYYPSDALSLDELAYWIAFSRVLGIGPARFKLLLDFFHDDVAAAWHAGSKELAQAGIDQKTIQSFLIQRSTITPRQELEKLQRLRAHKNYYPGTPVYASQNVFPAYRASILQDQCCVSQ